MDFDSDGVRLHYEVHGPERGAPLVVVHGFASDYLLDHLEVPSVGYLGYSMGARIGLQVVMDSPSRVRRAVLGGIGASGSIRNAAAIAEAFLRDEPTDDRIAQSFYHFASARPTNDLKALAACITGLQPQWDPAKLSAIHTPILVVAGDRDELAPDAPELVELIPSSRLVTIAGRDHMGAVPAREFKQAAVEFLSAE
jgi:pimeloyl-ACP methyl ester carboxylesterase